MNNSYKGNIQMESPAVVREYDIKGTKYTVKSVFVGKQDIKTTILKLAEQKTLNEMGLDISFS